MLQLDAQAFSCADDVVRWIIQGPYQTVHRDYDVADILAAASPHPFIDDAVVRVIDEGPAAAREKMLGFLCLRPNSSPALRAAYQRWAGASWLNDPASSGEPFGKLVSWAAQHGFNHDLAVVRAFLALGKRFNARTEWTWMAVYADPAGLGAENLERTLRSGVQIDDLQAGAIGVAMRAVALEVVMRAARALSGQRLSARNAFWSALRKMRSDELPGVEAALGLSS